MYYQMHFRGLNLEENDDGGRPPFPRLSELYII